MSNGGPSVPAKDRKMTDKDNGGPAFPGSKSKSWHDGIQNREAVTYYNGMSLRDWYAGMALQGLLSGQYKDNGAYNLVGIPQEAFLIADAMIEARGK